MAEETNTDQRPWTFDDIGDQMDRTVLVTGANSGIGLEAAKELAARGARVVLACRSEEKATRAIEEIRDAYPGSSSEFLHLDLADLASVRSAAARFHESHDRLDILINNAGVMALPRMETADGFEMQLGTNHLGHFALTGLLLDQMLGTSGSRIVTVSSGGHRMGRMHFDDLQSEKLYGRWRVYGRSKLANLLFTYELQRRLAESGAAPIAVAAHPGGANTNLGRLEPGQSGYWFQRVWRPVFEVMTQSAAMGALPMLRAAVDPGVNGGEYYGPSGFAEQHGSPVKVRSNKRSHDRRAQARLWEASEQLTGVVYDFGNPDAGR